MCLYAAFFMLILLHIGVLHGYMNFVGEIMRFADRQFYQVVLPNTYNDATVRVLYLLIYIGLVDKHIIYVILSQVEYTGL